MAYRDVILSKTTDYVRTKKLSAANRGAIVMVDCPFCHFVKSAQIIPAMAHIKCVHCGKMFSLIDLVRHAENKHEESEETILNYLRDLLKLDVQTTKDSEDLDKLLALYVSRGWALVPCSKAANVGHVGEKVMTGKEVIQAEWQKKENRTSTEWVHWINSGLNVGVRTGQVSNLTIIDFDLLTKEEKAELVKAETKESRKTEILAKKVIPDEIKNIMGATLMQESHGGFHAFYLYTPDLRKTAFNFSGFHIDVENDLGQVIIPPSQRIGVEEEFEVEGDVKKRIVGYAGRKFINELPMIAIPEEFKTWLKAHMKPQVGQTPVEVGNVSSEAPTPIPDGVMGANGTLKDIQGNRNNTLMALGGIFRKEMNLKQTQFVLSVLNKHLLEKPLPSAEIAHIITGLSNYTGFDEQDLGQDIVAYLKDTDTASKNEIESAIFGGRTTSENKKRLDKTLMYLIREEKIIKKNSREYRILKDMEWNTELLNIGLPVNFKVPYFGDYANFNWGDIILIGGNTKVGKCFSKDTGILMGDGNVKKVQHITPGEVVQGINNTKRLVQEVCVGYGATYKIEPTNNSPFTVNGEHILCLVHTATDEKINMSVNDYLKQTLNFKHCYKLYRDTVDWKKQEVTIDPYFMGLWLGDGDSARQMITSGDQEIVSYLEKYAGKLNSKLAVHSSKGNCARYNIVRKNNKQEAMLLDRLREYNVINNKHVPSIFKLNDRDTRLQLLAGLVDSDGYLDKQGNFEFSFVNETLANDVAFVARSLGFSAKVKKNKAAFNTIRYRFKIVGDTTCIPTLLKRKQSVKKEVKKNPLYSGFRITAVGNQAYYGFVLDGDHLFLLDNFIVNHNTHVAINIIKRLVAQGVQPRYLYNENGSRYAKVSLQLGLKPGDFEKVRCSNPADIIMRKQNAVYIYDWYRPNDFTKTAEDFDMLADKLERSQSLMFCFAQLKDGNAKNGTQNEWFAKDQIRQFVALSAKYMYDDNDGINTYFDVDDVRDSKTGAKKYKIPCKYRRDTKEVVMQEEIEREEHAKAERQLALTTGGK